VDDDLVHVRTSRQVRRRGLVAHVGPVGDIATKRGLTLTSPVATFLDLAMHLDDKWLLAVGDAVVRRGRRRWPT
jgi:hypothetical protein